MIPCRLSHVADHSRRYPGEPVTFYTRVQAQTPLSGYSLRLTLPDGLLPGEARATGGALPLITRAGGTSTLIWEIEAEVEAGARHEIQVEATVAPTGQDVALESRAVVASLDGRRWDAATAEIAVSAKGRYLKYLPALYREDELLGRFLMLFESFWGPIEQQIDQLPLYLDPRMAPPEFLPWLASWLNLVLDESWPEERRRRLLRSAATLYRKRGTRQGLVEYLEIYTGVQARIIEHRAYNLRLGPEARLGTGVALGTANVPHTFTVVLRLPAIVGEDSTRLEAERRRTIQAIIEAEKPAHTAYSLRIETET